MAQGYGTYTDSVLGRGDTVVLGTAEVERTARQGVGRRRLQGCTRIFPRAPQHLGRIYWLEMHRAALCWG